MKKFKKPKEQKDKKGDREKEDISCLVYWGDDKNNVIAASWDKVLRLYDDGDTEREGQQRYKLDRHNDAINYVDFRLEHKITASASDDGQLLLYNHHSHRVDGELSPPDITDLPEVKICKFLEGHDCLVSADLDGYLNFYAVAPSPLKNMMLARAIYYNEKEQIQRKRPAS